MRPVPTFLKGVFREVLVLAMDEALAGAGLETLLVVACSFTLPPEVVRERFAQFASELRRRSDLVRTG